MQNQINNVATMATPIQMKTHARGLREWELEILYSITSGFFSSFRMELFTLSR